MSSILHALLESHSVTPSLLCLVIRSFSFLLIPILSTFFLLISFYFYLRNGRLKAENPSLKWKSFCNGLKSENTIIKTKITNNWKDKIRSSNRTRIWPWNANKSASSSLAEHVHPRLSPQGWRGLSSVFIVNLDVLNVLSKEAFKKSSVHTLPLIKDCLDLINFYFFREFQDF